MQKINITKYLSMFVILVLLQVLILNKISLFYLATPYLYIYFIIKLPFDINRNALLIISFFLGLIIDIFSNTPGINAAATTLVAFCSKPIESFIFTLDDYESQTPRLSILRSAFIKYTGIIIIIHHTTLILLESFSLFNLTIILLKIVTSSLLTFILILGLENFYIKKVRAWGKRI